MKLHQQEVEIKSSGLNSSDFKIKTSAKSFQILSNSLYSDKILAVVREYLSNAIDAHRLNNNPNPFQVNLPDEDLVMDTGNWSVRDFGPGLDDSQIQELFCTYFSSSKDQSNDFTGALGLGCKSGFAYTSSFFVTSWKDGIEYKYVMSSEDNIPKAFKLSEKVSEEPSGVKIEIPVNPEDFSRFRECTKYVLIRFPENLVPESLKTEDRGIFLNSNLKRVDYKGYSQSYGNLNAVMGNVAYPIQPSLIRERAEKVWDDYCKHLYWKGSYDLHFEIGELDVAPSREQLSYDTQTTQAIIQKLEIAINDYLSLTLNREDFKSLKLLDKFFYDWEKVGVDSKFAPRYRDEVFEAKAVRGILQPLENLGDVICVLSNHPAEKYSTKRDGSTDRTVFNIIETLSNKLYIKEPKLKVVVTSDKSRKFTQTKVFKSLPSDMVLLLVKTSDELVDTLSELFKTLTNTKIYSSLEEFCNCEQITIKSSVNAKITYTPSYIKRDFKTCKLSQKESKLNLTIDELMSLDREKELIFMPVNSTNLECNYVLEVYPNATLIIPYWNDWRKLKSLQNLVKRDSKKVEGVFYDIKLKFDSMTHKELIKYLLVNGITISDYSTIYQYNNKVSEKLPKLFNITCPAYHSHILNMYVCSVKAEACFKLMKELDEELKSNSELSDLVGFYNAQYNIGLRAKFGLLETIFASESLVIKYKDLLNELLS